MAGSDTPLPSAGGGGYNCQSGLASTQAGKSVHVLGEGPARWTQKSNDLFRTSPTALSGCGTLFDLPGKESRKKEIDARMAAPGFWDNPEKAQATIHELKAITKVLDQFGGLIAAGHDLKALAELAEEDGAAETEAELTQELARVQGELRPAELQAMLSGPHDYRGAFITIHAGAGGTDACDWTQMLLRMYQMWLGDHGYQSEIVDASPGEEAGLRSVTLEVQGDYAYGYLQAETGVHRLVRMSPFDANARRHTSFASVDVMPEIEDDIDIEIREEDLEVETMRAGGAGGQHVNKTSSAVRLTHLPSGIVVKCQNERSQHKNRKMAMSMLKAKLVLMEEQKRQAEVNRLYDEKGEIAFGSQIRSYVLQPYQLVKDHRTDEETAKVQDVLDGHIDNFIEAYLRQKMSGGKTSGGDAKNN
jgi:peptide chain release factor 2